MPDAVAEDDELSRLVEQAVDDSRFVYNELLAALDDKLADEPNALLLKKTPAHCRLKSMYLL